MKIKLYSMFDCNFKKITPEVFWCDMVRMNCLHIYKQIFLHSQTKPNTEWNTFHCCSVLLFTEIVRIEKAAKKIKLHLWNYLFSKAVVRLNIAAAVVCNSWCLLRYNSEKKSQQEQMKCTKNYDKVWNWQKWCSYIQNNKMNEWLDDWQTDELVTIVIKRTAIVTKYFQFVACTIKQSLNVCNIVDSGVCCNYELCCCYCCNFILC